MIRLAVLVDTAEEAADVVEILRARGLAARRADGATDAPRRGWGDRVAKVGQLATVTDLTAHRVSAGA